MKSKKITRIELEPGMLVVTSDAKDATVFVLADQHPDTGFVWKLIRYVRKGIVNGGWVDYSLMRHPTKAQLAQPENVTMLAHYRAALG